MRPQPLAACLALVVFLPFGGASATPPVTPAAPATPTPASTTVPATATAAPAAPTGDPTKGRLLAYTCQGCHGVTGYKNAYPSYRVPKIGGQSGQYLTQALIEYRQGKRKHPTMQAQAQSFSEQDIADISAFLSTLK
ncbi:MULTISPECIES: c-type cytochrome [Xanthomonas]|uniref:Cytochrome C n=1 Tax=Xanthomonas cucurbitae TaxID=56453 RepID=A0A2S7DCH9_9XANT|nr:cytochrome c [Xanthomonas cucurbitae]PPU71538.1 cytochrome C [Xanthomonas cucurbitae]QHG87398.1 cytochrome c [Xanthomonas cucurbitae]WDM69483.1 cytochrome c [Xanthomonas cucurbitae]WDM73357.1 cytochrome c [Xanthomonas cucurbitae]WDM73986.1 cytochrome c [Xanthomonas cucurbitae]